MENMNFKNKSFVVFSIMATILLIINIVNLTRLAGSASGSVMSQALLTMLVPLALFIIASILLFKDNIIGWILGSLVSVWLLVDAFITSPYTYSLFEKVAIILIVLFALITTIMKSMKKEIKPVDYSLNTAFLIGGSIYLANIITISKSKGLMFLGTKLIIIVVFLLAIQMWHKKK